MATPDKTQSDAKPARPRSRAKPKVRTPEEVARAGFDALAKHDIDGVLANWSPEGVQDWVAVGVFRGHDEIRHLFGQVLAATPDFEIVVDRVIADENSACVQWRSSGTFTGAPFMGIDPTGRTVELRGVDVMEVEDGLIVRNTVYYDGLAFARGVGMIPVQGSTAERALYTAFNATTRLRRAIQERTQGGGEHAEGDAR